MPLRVIDDAEDRTRAWRELEQRIARSSVAIDRRLSVPGWSGRSEVYWDEAAGFWASISSDQGYFRLWLGSSDDELPDILTPDVEVNIAGANGRARMGRLVADEIGHVYLARRPGLRGGRNDVSPADFRERISGFILEEIQYLTDKFEDVYVIIDIYGDDLRQLGRFAEQCKLLRARVLGSGTRTSGDDTAEEPEGPIIVPPSDHDRVIDRRHGRIFRYLRQELKRAGYQVSNRRSKRLGPDLVAYKSHGTEGLLFEIKADGHAQYVFAGIGQLLVYSYLVDRAVRRVLVLPAIPTGTHYRTALEEARISTAVFDDSGSVVLFHGLVSLLDG